MIRTCSFISRLVLLKFGFILLLAGCKKILEPSLPENYFLPSQVYSSDSLVEDAIWQVKKDLMESFSFLNGQASRFGGLCADELKNSGLNNEDAPFLNNNILPGNSIIQKIWQRNYSYIYILNDLINGLTNNTKISTAVRRQVLGEALFLRALFYFYFVNFFGDLPLVTGTDFKINANMPRSKVVKIYEQIISDLKKAQDSLPVSYTPVEGYPQARVRVNRAGATALLSQVYLFNRQWEEAEQAATEVILSPLYHLESDMNKVFLAGSNETIFEFVPVSSGYNTAEGGMFVPILPSIRPPVIFTDDFMQNIESGDRRRQWIRTATLSGIQYYSPYKYKVADGPPYTEFNIALRLAGQFLVRAEALAWQGRITEAQQDLSVIRTRAGLPASTAIMTQQEILNAILHERRIEYFAEWGNRWLDLIRMPSHDDPLNADRRLADDILSKLKSGSWSATDKLWPVPTQELNRNPFLVQNPGY